MAIGTELRWVLIVGGVLLLVGIYLWGRRNQARNAGEDAFVASRSEPLLDAPEFDDVVEEPELAPEYEPVEHVPLATQPAFEDVIQPAISSGRRDPVISDGDTEATVELRHEPLVADESTPVPRREVPVVTTTADAPVEAPAQSSTRRAPAQPNERKIVTLRLPAGTAQFPGNQLQTLFAQAGLTHGKYSIYHRLEGERSVFSVASMVEPGTFDTQTLADQEFSGITLFAVLPGPVEPLAAVDAMLVAGRHFEKVLGASLQDERGNPLNDRLVTRLRNETIAFQRASDAGAAVS